MVMCMVARTGRELQRYNNGCRQVVGCVPYRYKNGVNEEEGLEVLLISSQKSDKKMLFPKGGWEIDEGIEEAAARETFEEAGVLGTVEKDLGNWMFKSKRYGTYYEGFMYSMFVKEVSEFWPEKDLRSRRWVTVEEAREVCQYQWMKEALDKFAVLSSSSDQEEDNVDLYCSVSEDDTES